MGNGGSAVYEKRISRLLPEEQAQISDAFDKMTEATGAEKGSRKSVSLEMLKAYVSEALPEAMIIRLFNGIRRTNTEIKSGAISEEFTKEQLNVYTSDLYRGHVDQRGRALLQIIAITEDNQVQGSQVQQFIDDLIGALLHVLQFRKLLNGWNLKHSFDSVSGGIALSAHLLSKLKPIDKRVLTEDQMVEFMWQASDIGDWVYRIPLLSTFLLAVFSHGLSVMVPDSETSYSLGSLSNLLPKCPSKAAPCDSVLGLLVVMFINSHLPQEAQRRWQPYFSTRAHGESFSQLCAQIIGRGPTILIVKDTGGNIFGGFASQAWEMKPQFQGDSTCFLFSIVPRMEVYMYSGYNDHYMYLNSGQQTLPNGLGMGGQHNYFGLWIDSDFGQGHSKAKPRCTTYNSRQLSSTENFKIDVLEVWGVGYNKETDEKSKKSILDADPDARALLDMAGVTRHSDGLREKAKDEEEDGD
ncbi:MTOR-associated protein MEAK7 isoform X2 [Lissotriton helveticus]